MERGKHSGPASILLDAVDASVFVVAAGPTKYGSVVLPDADIITELESRGQLFRTDMNDTACAVNPSKIGAR